MVTRELESRGVIELAADDTVSFLGTRVSEYVVWCVDFLVLCYLSQGLWGLERGPFIF